jgi:CBS domain-containing protein
MTQPVVTVAADTKILEVARLLLEHRIGGVPVVKERAVIGVITESDLFRLIVARETQDSHPSAETAAGIS